MKNITFLGPIGATFSHDAYNILAEAYKAPRVNQKNCYIAADSNGAVLRLIRQHGGYGAVAMETLAEGRVAEPLESFIELLALYPSLKECPLRIIGAVRLKLHFCLMAMPRTKMLTIDKVVAHPKALGACSENIKAHGFTPVNVSSNGEAAKTVSKGWPYEDGAALGPRSAAEKYGLKILSDAFEDSEAVTTFFLIAPASERVRSGGKNRMLIVYRVPHEAGALVRSLTPFEREDLNLIQIHSVHAGNRTYHFAIELEVEARKLEALDRAMAEFSKHVETYLPFGPFEVISR